VTELAIARASVLSTVEGSLLDLSLQIANAIIEREVERDPELQSERGAALRALLYLFRRDDAVRTLRAG